MARTTISIPDALRDRMGKVKEPVNWSQVAAKAFEVKLGELAATRQEKSMLDVVERLRASKIKSGDQRWLDGANRGIDWAKNVASFNQLSRLATEYERHSDWFEDSSGHELTPKEVANMALGLEGIKEEVGLIEMELEVFWIEGPFEAECFDDKRMTGVPAFMWDAIADPEWLRGFVQGAVNIYKTVEDQL